MWFIAKYKYMCIVIAVQGKYYKPYRLVHNMATGSLDTEK